MEHAQAHSMHVPASSHTPREHTPCTCLCMPMHRIGAHTMHAHGPHTPRHCMMCPLAHLLALRDALEALGKLGRVVAVAHPHVHLSGSQVGEQPARWAPQHQGFQCSPQRACRHGADSNACCRGCIHCAASYARCRGPADMDGQAVPTQKKGGVLHLLSWRIAMHPHRSMCANACLHASTHAACVHTCTESGTRSCAHIHARMCHPTLANVLAMAGWLCCSIPIVCSDPPHLNHR
eukprot:351299-Chlamydomonas_euryale.AAC.5